MNTDRFFAMLIGLMLSTPVLAYVPDGDSACLEFEWGAWKGVSERGAIILKLPINNKLYAFQLDTGTYASFISADVEMALSSTSLPSAQSMQGFDLKRLAKAQVLPGKANRQSTLGLEELQGKYVVIDYQANKFCTFNKGDMTTSEAVKWGGTNIAWSDMDFVNGKLILETSINEGKSFHMAFDTGSSFFPVILPEDKLAEIKGIDTHFTERLSAKSWGRTLHLKSKRINGKLTIGANKFYNVMAYGLIDSQVRLNKSYIGIIGNALFWDGAVVLDLTDGINKFGFLAPRKE